MANLSVEQSLMKAKSHVKKGDLAEAQKLYETILQNFSNNIRAQQGIGVINKPIENNVIQNPPQESVSELVNLYNQGQLKAMAEQAQALTKQYPKAFIVWNILGAAQKGLGNVFEASQAFKRVTDLNSNYADGFNNLGVTLKDLGKLDEAIEAYNKALSITN